MPAGRGQVSTTGAAAASVAASATPAWYTDAAVDRTEDSRSNIRSPGHDVRLKSRWPDTRGFVTTVPSGQRELPADV